MGEGALDLVFFFRKLVFLALLVISGAVWAAESSSAQHISHGLVAYFPMNGDAQDLSGNGNHALQALPSATDRFGDSAGR